MEKGKFEQSWKGAFESAEVAPSDSVWTSVELGLVKAAGNEMKQRLLFYKLVAAASLVFTIALVGVYYISSTETNLPGQEISRELKSNREGNTAIKNDPVAKVESEYKSDTPVNVDQSELETTRIISNRIGSKNPDDNSTAVVFSAGIDDDIYTVKVEGVNDPLKSFGLFASSPKSKLVTTANPTLTIQSNQSNADPGMVLLAKLKDDEKKYQKEQSKPSENLWTSIGFGAGSYNPNTPGTSTTFYQASTNSYATYSNSPTSGASYSFGVQLGGRIANRLVLLGGVSYLSQNASYTSNTGMLDATNVKASLNDFSGNGTLQSVSTSPYDVSSNLQYISLPVQAGYVIVDRKFAIQLNGGVSTDFFVLNTLTPDVDSIDKLSQGPGDDSPYRPVNFSGLVGTEFSYKFSDRYRLAVNPGMRYVLNSIYKSENSVDVSPITYDVSFRFRYIFK